MTSHRPSIQSRQKGFTLIEMSVAFVIIGISIMLLWQFIGRQVQHTAETDAQDLLARSQKSLISYALIHGRLPCPASNAAGLEDCGAMEGKFPFVTAGLPEAAARKILYTLAADSTLLTSPPPVLVLTPNTADGKVTTLVSARPPLQGRLLDLCQALTSNPEKAQDLAFQLRPDTGLPFARSLTGRDQTLSNGQLANRLYCQQQFGPGARAHPNIHLAAVSLSNSLNDFHAQKELTSKLIESDVVGLTYTFLNAVWTWTRTVPKVQNAWSAFQKTDAVDAPSLIAVLVPMAQIASDTVTVARQASNVSRAIALLTINEILLGNIEEVQGRVNSLVAETASRAETSANIGLQLRQAFATRATPSPIAPPVGGTQ